MKLTKEQKVRRAWVKALRSGKYKQGTGYLRQRKSNQRIDRFCCLGVLCDLAVKAKVLPKPEIEKLDDMVEYSYQGCTGGLPDAVLEWSGLLSSVGEYEDPLYGNTDLTNINDDKKLSFDKIADLIESNPQGLFSGEGI